MCEERLRFGEFELRPGSGELFQDGTPVKLQPQPAKVLELLARHPGEVVSREELRRHLWGEETFVDFEHGLNFSIRQLRRALGDSADSPRFVETVPRHGYRFLQPVTVEEIGAPVPEAPAPAALSPRMRTRRRVVLGIAGTVALLLVLGLGGAQRPNEPARFLPPSGVSREAWEAYLEGRHFTRREATPEEREKGVVAFQQAILLAPRFAAAYTGLSRAEMFSPQRWQDKFPVAEAAAHRAVALDPSQSEAHFILGFISFLRLDIRRAQEETERALATDPNLAPANALRAKYLASLGLQDEAVAAAQRARDLDPEGNIMRPDLLCYHLLLARRYSEAIDCGQHIAATALPNSPDAPWARLWALWAAQLAGNSDRALAIANAAAARQNDDLSPRLATLQDVWRWDLQRLQALTPRIYSADRAADLLALGERERALDLLQQTAERHDSWDLAFLAVDPRLDGLRGDPRFEKLLQQLSLPRVSPPPPRGA